MKNSLGDYPKPGSKPPKMVNASDLSRMMGVEPSTIRSWREKGMPFEDVNGDELYVVTEAVLWWANWKEVIRLPSESETDPNDKEALECEKLRLENARRELKLENERGRLVRRDNVLTQIEQMFHKIRSRLESAPEELASSLPPELRADYLADCRQKMGLILREMEGWGD